MLELALALVTVTTAAALLGCLPRAALRERALPPNDPLQTRPSSPSVGADHEA